MNFIAVDWGKDFRKRSAYLATASSRTVSRLHFDGRLTHLLAYAENLQPPILIGIDAAIGYPNKAWDRLQQTRSTPDATFVDFLLRGPLPERFFESVRTPENWSPSQPFIQPPPGSFSLTAFMEASKGGLYREIDRRLNAQPIFLTSGIPGTVGSGTRALWQELHAAYSGSNFRVWPFEGALDELLPAKKPIIAEIYPKACYGIALSDALPSLLQSIAKTKQPAREAAIAQLLESTWVARLKVTLEDIDQAIANEDDFDALFSAAALLRMYLEKASFERSDSGKHNIEGDILGSGSIEIDARNPSKPRKPASLKARTKKKHAETTYPCPIPGCAHFFLNSRSGWDAHVASLKRHPDWYPNVADPAVRKRLFKKEFSSWFKNW